MSFKKFSNKRKFYGPSTSTAERFNKDSYQSGSVKFKRRLERIRPSRGSRWNYRAQSDAQPSNVQTRPQNMPTQQHH